MGSTKKWGARQQPLQDEGHALPEIAGTSPPRMHGDGAATLFDQIRRPTVDQLFGIGQRQTLIGMVDAAFENKSDFYVLDDLNEQKLYNCARNVEIAVWKMSSTRNANGEVLLLSNELDPTNPNLSFEREFGRVIALLDFMSRIVADKHGRSITRLTQSIATAVFLPVSALGFK